MFSKEYLTALAERTGFRTDSLQKQMKLLDILREMSRHPLLGKKFALKGGTAINLFWFRMPRLSVDIDLNYIGDEDRETMLRNRPLLENELKTLIESRGISTRNIPEEHAGGKWRLQAPGAFGGTFSLELDLTFTLRIPVWGTETRSPFLPDEDFHFDFTTVSFAELFGGKIKALLERSAPRDLYDTFRLSQLRDSYDVTQLRKALILLGITSKDDWRKKDFRTIYAIDEKMMEEQLVPLLHADEILDLDVMKTATRSFLANLMEYEDSEKRFMSRFLDEGVYEPLILFGDESQAKRVERHPAVLWKLLNHRVYLGLDNQAT